jgi:hypothetical protein
MQRPTQGHFLNKRIIAGPVFLPPDSALMNVADPIMSLTPGMEVYLSIDSTPKKVQRYIQPFLRTRNCKLSYLGSPDNI